MSIKLLTQDPADELVAVPGVLFPDDRGPAVQYFGEAEDPTSESVPTHTAKLATFFYLDPEGMPVRSSEVRFYVPEHLWGGRQPNRTAMRLVTQRAVQRGLWPPN